jgi:hypothetical protein
VLTQPVAFGLALLLFAVVARRAARR